MSLLKSLPYNLYCELTKSDDWVSKMTTVLNIRNNSIKSSKDLINHLNNKGYTLKKFYQLLDECHLSKSGISQELQIKKSTASIKVAILVANSKYHHWTNLVTPASDCRVLGRILKSMGFFTIILENVYSNGFKKAIEDISKVIPTNAYVFFYFAGHGFELCGTKYMLGIESSSDKYTINNGISENFILKHGFQNKPELYILLLDMCRKQPDRSINPEIYLNIPPAEEYTNVCNLIVGYATSPYMPSYEKLYCESDKDTSQVQHDTCDIQTSELDTCACCDNKLDNDCESDGIGHQITKCLKTKQPLNGISLYVSHLSQHLNKDEDFIKILEEVHKDFAKKVSNQALLQKPQKLDNVAKKFYLTCKVKGSEESEHCLRNVIHSLCDGGNNITIN